MNNILIVVLILVQLVSSVSCVVFRDNISATVLMISSIIGLVIFMKHIIANHK